ncbi:MAG: hypothetical protein GX226_04805 [Dehalococcoidales bacterium]|nr:hypothetical protein [Dehalococcoidales bacterium]
MACFLAPMTQAIVTTVIQKNLEKKEKLAGEGAVGKSGISWSRKLGWLNKLLWGGVVLLAFEHLWHGEIVPWPPFLTAMENPADIVPMLQEIATFGVGMAVFVTIIWGIIVIIAETKVKNVPKVQASPDSGGA